MNEKQRTILQNKSLHKYYDLLAEELNNAGLDMKKVLKPEVDIPWTTLTVKEFIWRPIQDIMLDKESTTQLNTSEINEIYQVVSRHLAKKFGIDLPFPDRFNEG